MRRRDALVQIEKLATYAKDPAQVMGTLWRAFCDAQPRSTHNPAGWGLTPTSSIVVFDATNPKGQKDKLKVSFDLKTRRPAGGKSKVTGVKIRAMWASLERD